MRIAALTAATLVLALHGEAGAQSVQFSIIANPPSKFYSRVAPFLERRDGTFLVENEGDAFSFPSDPGEVYELIPPRRQGDPYGIKEIFAFRNASTGTNPRSAGLINPSGALIGTTDLGGVSVGVPTATTGGTIFSLAPPLRRGGPWTETILHRFASCTVSPCDGFRPSGSLIRDKDGVYYGFTDRGGEHDGGTIFALGQDEGGAWQERVLHEFPAQSVPYQAYRGPVLDASGNLIGSGIFGGKNGFGFTFKLSRPSHAGGAWNYATLYQFTGKRDGGYPNTPVVVDKTGVLYATAGVGGAFSNGFGTDGGVAFTLAQDGSGAWVESVIHDFHGPDDGADSLLPLVQGSDGTLYGGSSGGNGTVRGMSLLDGTVFTLTPPAAPGAAWTETILKGFAYCGDGPCQEGINPFGPLTLTEHGASGPIELTGQTGYGGARTWGTVFKITVARSP